LLSDIGFLLLLFLFFPSTDGCRDNDLFVFLRPSVSLISLPAGAAARRGQFFFGGVGPTLTGTVNLPGKTSRPNLTFSELQRSRKFQMKGGLRASLASGKAGSNGRHEMPSPHNRKSAFAAH
jgi:hypothetical protein